MVNKIVKIVDPIGIHARPASAIVQTASKFKSEISILSNGRKANAKSVINLMALGVKANSEIEITCNGEDEANALEAVLNTFTNEKLI